MREKIKKIIATLGLVVIAVMGLPMAAGATSTPALGPIPIGFTVWIITLLLAVTLILTELDNPASPSVGRRVMGFIFAIGAWIFGLAPDEYVWVAQNNTLVSGTSNLFGAGITQDGILVMTTGILAYAMLRIIELLVIVMNRRKIQE